MKFFTKKLIKKYKKDIFRKYPNRYESIIGKLCQNLDTLDEPEAKAAMIWIVGEYAKKIANADALLHGFLENFLDEPVQVQLQLLTATVKLFLQKPKNTKAMVLNVLNLATKECDNPDLRDRGFIYWRLLSGGPKAAEVPILPSFQSQFFLSFLFISPYPSFPTLSSSLFIHL